MNKTYKIIRTTTIEFTTDAKSKKEALRTDQIPPDVCRVKEEAILVRKKK